LAGVVRYADPKIGEPKSITVKCPKCNTSLIDEPPMLLDKTGEYIIRNKRCPGCKKAVQFHPAQPYDKGILRFDTLNTRLNTPERLWLHTPEDRRSGPMPKAGGKSSKSVPAKRRVRGTTMADDDDDNEKSSKRSKPAEPAPMKRQIRAKRTATLAIAVTATATTENDEDDEDDKYDQSVRRSRRDRSRKNL
jgi:hypothetical protein